MHALNASTTNTAPHQSISIKWVENEPDRQMLVDDLMNRTEFSGTWPFMDWVEEAAADSATRLIGAYNSDAGQWAGFIAYHAESHITPEKPGKAQLEVEVSIESIYVTEQERKNGVATALMQVAMDAIDTTIQAIRAKNSLLKLAVRITFIADCYSETAHKVVTTGLSRLHLLQGESASIQNQISFLLDDD